MKFRKFLNIILFIGCVSAQTTVIIDGVVTDKQDYRLPDITVTYYRSDGIAYETTTNDTGYFELNIPTLGIEPEPFPTTFSLSQNYPNPFNPVTNIPLSISGPATFTIYNILGQEIQRATLNKSGEYKLKWGGLTPSGTRVGAGVFIYTLHEKSGASRSRKMVLLDAGGVSGLSVSHLQAMAFAVDRPPAFYEDNALTQVGSQTPTVTDSLTFSGEHIEPFGFSQFTADTFITQILNHGPIFLDSIPDIALTPGDTIAINLNDYFYNDDMSVYSSAMGDITDSLFSYIPDTAMTIVFQITATDAYYEPLSATSNAITLTATSVNLPPYFDFIDTLFTVEDSLVLFPLNHYAHDPNGDNLTITLNNLQHATWDNNGGYSAIFPDLNWFGIIDSLTFTASDNEYTVVSNPFAIIVEPIDDLPEFYRIIMDTTVAEDTPLIYRLSDYSRDIDGGESTWFFDVHDGTPLSAVFTGNDTIIIQPDLNVNGLMDSIRIGQSSGDFEIRSNYFDIIITPVNDAPIFNGNIADTTFSYDAFDPEYQIPLENLFSDPEGTPLNYSINLIEDLFWFSNDVYYIWPYQGDTLDVIITATDGELSTPSNNFVVAWAEEVILPPDTFNVHLRIEDFKTGNLIDGTSTFTIDGVEYISNTGTIDIALLEGVHSLNATNPNTIDGQVFNGEDYLLLKRPGDIEAFDVRAGPDDEAYFTISSIDTIKAQKVLSDVLMEESTLYLNHNGNGTVRFGPEDLNAAAWWDLSYEESLPYIENAITNWLQNHILPASLGKLDLQYIESLTNPTPGEPLLRMFMDSSVPGSGNNITSFDENNNITWCEASWPIGPGTGDMIVEISQAVLDLPDIAGQNPPIFGYDSITGFYYNNLGLDIFALGMAFPPETYFNN